MPQNWVWTYDHAQCLLQHQKIEKKKKKKKKLFPWIQWCFKMTIKQKDCIWLAHVKTFKWFFIYFVHFLVFLGEEGETINTFMLDLGKHSWLLLINIKLFLKNHLLLFSWEFCSLNSIYYLSKLIAVLCG